jgi:hypothetical protein
MRTRTNGRRRTAACAPRVEPLEDRWLLHGAPLWSLSVPAFYAAAPAAVPRDEGPVRFADGFAAGGAWHDRSAPAARDGFSPPGEYWFVVVVDTGPAGFGYVLVTPVLSPEAAFLAGGYLPRASFDFAPDAAASRPSGAGFGKGERYGPFSAAAPGGEDVARVVTLLGPVVREEAAVRAINPDASALVAAVSGGPAHGAEGPGPRAASPGASVPLTILVPASRVLRPSAGEVAAAVAGAARAAVESPGEPASPGGGLPSGNEDGRAPNPEALTLPRAEGLLTQGVRLGVAALGDAAGALAEPLLAAEGASADVLYWLGLSSWLLAAALAGEGARRYLRQRPAQPDLQPEADP